MYETTLKQIEKMVQQKKYLADKEKYLSEERYGKREAWLAEKGLSEGDVMVNERGTEYVFEADESRADDDCQQVCHVKVELPLKLQTYYIPF